MQRQQAGRPRVPPSPLLPHPRLNPGRGLLAAQPAAPARQLRRRGRSQQLQQPQLRPMVLSLRRLRNPKAAPHQRRQLRRARQPRQQLWLVRRRDHGHQAARTPVTSRPLATQKPPCSQHQPQQSSSWLPMASRLRPLPLRAAPEQSLMAMPPDMIARCKAVPTTTSKDESTKYGSRSSGECRCLAAANAGHHHHLSGFDFHRMPREA